LEEKRNELQNLQRKYSHLQRDTDNARTVEKNMSKFLKNMYTNSTGNSSINGNNNNCEGVLESLPRISIANTSSSTNMANSGKKKEGQRALVGQEVQEEDKVSQIIKISTQIRRMKYIKFYLI